MPVYCHLPNSRSNSIGSNSAATIEPATAAKPKPVKSPSIQVYPKPVIFSSTIDTDASDGVAVARVAVTVVVMLTEGFG